MGIGVKFAGWVDGWMGGIGFWVDWRLEWASCVGLKRKFGEKEKSLVVWYRTVTFDDMKFLYTSLLICLCSLSFAGSSPVYISFVSTEQPTSGSTVGCMTGAGANGEKEIPCENDKIAKGCVDCERIHTLHFDNVKLDDAYEQALVKLEKYGNTGYDNAEAYKMLVEIMSYDYGTLDSATLAILQSSFVLAKETQQKLTLNPLAGDFTAQLMDMVEDDKFETKADAIIGPKAYDLMNGAFALMAKGDRAAAMVLIGQAKLEAGSINLGWVERWECLQNSLAAIENGTIGPEQFAATMESCTNSSGGRRAATDRGVAIEELLDIFHSRKTFISSDAVIFPNPVKKMATVIIDHPIANQSLYKIVDAIGRTLMHGEFSGSICTMDLSTLTNGLHNIIITNGVKRLYLHFVKI